MALMVKWSMMALCCESGCLRSGVSVPGSTQSLQELLQQRDLEWVGYVLPEELER